MVIGEDERLDIGLWVGVFVIVLVRDGDDLLVVRVREGGGDRFGRN